MEDNISHTRTLKARMGSNFIQRQSKNLQLKLIRRGKEGHGILAKETIQQEDIPLGNICAPISEEANIIKQILPEVKDQINQHNHSESCGL